MKTKNPNTSKLKDLVVIKANDLVDAFYTLTLAEHKLILLTIALARNVPNLSTDTPITITTELFSKYLDVSPSSARKVLLEAKDTLFSRQFTYIDATTKKEFDARWCWLVSKNENISDIQIFFTPVVIKFIKDLDKNYTMTELSDFSVFRSRFGLRLFELIKKWQNLGCTQKFDIEAFRRKMGVSQDSYLNHSALSKNVIDVAVNEINSNSKKFGMEIYCNRIKVGNKITHLQFLINVKNKTKDITPKKTKISYKLSEKQIYKYANALGNYSEFAKVFESHGSEQFEAYVNRIAEKLRQEEYVEEWMDFLKELDFTPRYES